MTSPLATMMLVAVLANFGPSLDPMSSSGSTDMGKSSNSGSSSGKMTSKLRDRERTRFMTQCRSELTTALGSNDIEFSHEEIHTMPDGRLLWTANITTGGTEKERSTQARCIRNSKGGLDIIIGAYQTDESLHDEK